MLSKPAFHCGHPGCNHVATQKVNLKRHVAAKHSDVKPAFPCTWPGCNHVATEKGCLKRHIAVKHSDVKPAFPCEHPGCEYIATVKCNLKTHVAAKHSDVKPTFLCNWPGCKHASTRKSHLGEHMLYVHHGADRSVQKKFVCSDQVCMSMGAAFYSKTKLDAHRVAFHTTEGRQRRKREEEAMKKTLVLGGYTESFERGRTPAPGEFVREVYFDHRCALGRQFAHGEKKFAYVDFVVRCPSGRLVFLEVDESQHESYGQLCESTRMWNICESIVLAGEQMNVFWLRFHPDRHFRWNGKDAHFKPSERREQVVKFLDALQQSSTDPPMQVGYAYYDHDQFRALAVQDNEFHPDVKPGVVCIHQTDFLLAPPEALCLECEEDEDSDATNEMDQGGIGGPPTKRARVCE